MDRPVPDPASFRDPKGTVYRWQGRIFRGLSPQGAEQWAHATGTGLIDRLIADGRLLAATELPRHEAAEIAPDADRVFEHPAVPFISYPYEWCGSALRAAALLHLDIQIDALAAGLSLADATAYNIQFIGPRPVHIDHLSFQPYVDGEFWAGQRQFVQEFLNPLLLEGLLHVPFNTWYRGGLDGISCREINALLPWWRKLHRGMLINVVLPAHLERLARGQAGGVAAQAPEIRSLRFPRAKYERMLRHLRAWIAGLHPARLGDRMWSDYADTHGYSSQEMDLKRAWIGEMVAATGPRILWDVGCNTGDFAAVALANGAETVIGFESDHGALEAAFARAERENLSFLPLYLDAANPSPNQGWAESERRGLSARGQADAVLALALVHHLAIGQNVPIANVVDWIVSLAPSGVIEFVPKDDPRVQQLLSLRQDIFEDYTEETFRAALAARAHIERSVALSPGGRCLAWFRR